jgi:hypothetical protein
LSFFFSGRLSLRLNVTIIDFVPSPAIVSLPLVQSNGSTIYV